MIKGAPKWCEKAKIEMVKKNINQTQIAEAIGTSRNYVSQVLNGYAMSRPMIEKISAYLGISSDY